MARGFKGGSSISGGNAESSDILSGKSAYVNGTKIDGTMPNNGAISGIINAVADEISISSGYHNGLGKVKINVTDQGKLIAGNLRKNVTILGVTGSLEEGVDTSDANATAGDILSGKTAYVKGSKITGNIPSVAAKTVTPSTSAQTAVSAGNYCSGNITVGAIPNQQNGGTWTPSSSAQTMVAANKYLKTAVVVAAIPNQTDGGAKYATTTAQTIATAGKYITSNITLGALSQSNLSSANILRGKTITISNGSSNVWSVGGSNTTLKMVSGSVAKSGTKTFYWGNTEGTGYTCNYARFNPGFTPVCAFGTGGGFHVFRSALTTFWGYNRSGYFGTNYSGNSGFSWTSSAVDLPVNGDTLWYWCFGY